MLINVNANLMQATCILQHCYFKAPLFHCKTILHVSEGVVSKETVVLRRWGSSIQKFGFINGVDNVNRSDEGLTL